MYSILVAALAEDQRRRCPCGAVIQQLYCLCRGCRRQCLEIGDRVTAPSRRSSANARLFRNASPLTGAVIAPEHRQRTPGLMLTALTLIVLAAIVLTLILLAVVVVGIRQETHSAELSDVAPSPVTGLVRRLTGLSVRRPTPTAVRDRGQGEGNPPGPAPRPRATT
jgi:hypothetical protein